MIKHLPKPMKLVSFAVVVAAAGALPAIASQTAPSPRAHGHAARSKSSRKGCFHVRVGHRTVERCLVRGPRGPRGFLGPAGAGGSRGRRGPAGATGPPGTARAYALVAPAGVGPTASTNGLVSAQTSNFASVRRAGTGTYCLGLAAGIDPTKTAPAVSGDAGNSSGGVVPLAVLNSSHPSCAPSELEVDTFNVNGPGLSDGAGFTIVVP